MAMNIDKLIDEITDQVYGRLYSDTAFAVRDHRVELKDIAPQTDLMITDPTACAEQVRKVCTDAAELGVSAVCVASCHTAAAAEALNGSGVKVCTLVGFPTGQASATAKAAEALEAVREGASEIEMVVNFGAVKSGDWKAVRDEIAMVVRVAEGRAAVKVIIGTRLLTEEEIVKASVTAKIAGACMIVNSSGPTGPAPSAELVGLVRQAVGPETGIKVSGITDVPTAAEMLAAGACRVGICKKEK